MSVSLTECSLIALQRHVVSMGLQSLRMNAFALLAAASYPNCHPGVPELVALAAAA